MPSKDELLFDFAVAQARENLTGRTQANINFDYLLNCIDQIHDALCPNHIGTWQERAEEAVRVAQGIPGRLESLKQATDNFLKAIEVRGLTVRR